jgi:hypothetical protein
LQFDWRQHFAQSNISYSGLTVGGWAQRLNAKIGHIRLNHNSTHTSLPIPPHQQFFLVQ